MDLAERRNIVLDGTIGDGPDALVFRFRPFAWTAEASDVLKKAQDCEKIGDYMASINGLIALTVSLLESWDLTDGGKPVPITAAALRALDYDLIVSVLDAVLVRSMPARAEREAVLPSLLALPPVPKNGMN